MNFVCPHCAQHVELDEFEMLEIDTLHDDFHCARCGETFAAYINDCMHCAAEQTFVWKAVPTEAELAAVACDSCGHVNSAPGRDEHDSLF